MESIGTVQKSPEANAATAQELQDSGFFLQQIFNGSWMTQAVWVAAELGIADLLSDGPCSVETLAEKTNSQPDALYRVMRALASAGIFAEGPARRFELTGHAFLLRSDAAGSQRAFATMMGAEFHGAWGELLHSVQTGEPGFQKRFGTPAFRYMMEHPQRHAIYDKAMGGYGQSEVQAMMDAYDFSAFGVVADIGGGSGMLMTAVLKRYPHLKGILFDLPPVAERARSAISNEGLSSRCRIEGGDFLASVPSGADAYILQHIIHDWEDVDAVAILSRCREAMGPESRLLLVESVIPPGNGPCFGKWLDLMMLLVGGRERTEKEYKKLFSDAGLTLNRIVPTAVEISILEAAGSV